jgi:hypothetical protein
MSPYSAALLPDQSLSGPEELIMKTTINAMCAITALGCLGTTTAMAQESDGGIFIYSTYFYCDGARQDRVDEIVEKVDKPAYDAAVDDGSIVAWGYMAHHTGGKWRRAQYHMAPTLEALFATHQTIGDQIEAKNEKLTKEAGQICNAHDDYVWRTVAGNEQIGKRGSVGFSTYYICDHREAQADALVKKVFAPVYDKLVSEGKLVSWGWLEHIVGGEYRRLATMTARDLPSLIKARTETVEAVEDESLGDMIGEICDSHTDYIWDIKFEKG